MVCADWNRRVWGSSIFAVLTFSFSLVLYLTWVPLIKIKNLNIMFCADCNRTVWGDDIAGSTICAATPHLIWSAHENNKKFVNFQIFVVFLGLLSLRGMIRLQNIGKNQKAKSKSNDRWPLDYPTFPRQQFLSKEAPTAILAEIKFSSMKLNLASCRITTTVISCCLDKIATKLCHNASKWSLKWPVNIVESRRIIPEFKLEENWAKIIGLFVRILDGNRGNTSKLYILHLIFGWLKILHFQMSV